MSHWAITINCRFQYDSNHDGFLSRKELKRLIKENPGQCQDLPKGISKAIIAQADIDNDGQLDFEEFYKLSLEHKWLVREICVRYCRYLVPLRDGAISDETGKCDLRTLVTTN